MIFEYETNEMMMAHNFFSGFFLPPHSALRFVAINLHIVRLNVLSLRVFLMVAQSPRRANHLQKQKNTQKFQLKIHISRVVCVSSVCVSNLPSIFASDDSRV